MHLNLYSPLADEYNSNAQKIRVITESWVARYIFCPSCGIAVSNYENNKPVADFYCLKCNEDYELKSKNGSMGKKIVDGAYTTMITRLQSNSDPNFFFLNYEKNTYDIKNFVVIPKHFFVPEIIEKRKPLSLNARRAGWVGCNILLDTIPESGKIFYIKENIVQSKDKVIEDWNRTSFLKENKNIQKRGWILEIMKCIEKLDNSQFTLSELYQFEKQLKMKYPENNNIQAKIRQQLQVLRDKNYLEFMERGKYRIR